MLLEEEVIDVTTEAKTHLLALNSVKSEIPYESLQSKEDKVLNIIIEYCAFLLADQDCFLFAAKAFFPRNTLSEEDAHSVQAYETANADERMVIKKMHIPLVRRPQARAELGETETIWNRFNDSKHGAAFAGENRHCLFFAMPFLGEMNLSDALKNHPSIIDHFHIILASVLTIHAMHQKLIRHNDLHHENIRISKISDQPHCFRAYLIDLDEARRVSADDKPTNDIKAFCQYILRQNKITKEQYPELYECMRDDNLTSMAPLIDLLKLEIAKLDVRSTIKPATK